LAPALFVLLIGAWTGADATAALQLMVSQPLVAGWLCGAALGEPAAGLAVGVPLQAMWSRALALGGGSFPATGPGAVAAAAVAAMAVQDPESTRLGLLVLPPLPAYLAALVVGIAVAEAGRHLVQWLRRRRAAWVAAALEAAESQRPGALVRVHLRGVSQGALAGATLAGVGTIAGMVLLLVLAPVPAADASWVFLPLTASLAAASVVQGIPRRSAWGWLGAALLAGAGGALL
jgi:mannose/fructose/N-acetylgalactosamine-specific phosphotransferase system component IIC